ncbi:MAG TPA: MarR family transcriptional regulator [Mycobacteriales bacterium]|nr:MarR family transcriptional regulator [Mycobacteriales bacterium]
MPNTTTPPSATERVHAALVGRPSATAAGLAEETGLGRSTVTKALTGLEAAGLAHRVPGGRDGGKRLPDMWEAPPAEPSPAKTSATSPGRLRPTKPAAGPDGAERLGRGQLRELVLTHLRDHPGDAFSPSALSAALGRSAGAISNAAETLVAASQVERSVDRPRRYRISA